MSRLLDIPETEKTTPLAQRFWSWLLNPGPALAFALLLISITPFLMNDGQEKGSIHNADVSHVIAMQIVTQGPDGKVERRDPKDIGQGSFAVPLTVGDTLQLVLSSPESDLSDKPQNVLLIEYQEGALPHFILENTKSTLQKLPNTRSLYTLPHPLVAKTPLGKKRYYLILTPTPVQNTLKAELLERATSGSPLPLLKRNEAEALSAIEASLPMEVQ